MGVVLVLLDELAANFDLASHIEEPVVKYIDGRGTGTGVLMGCLSLAE